MESDQDGYKVVAAHLAERRKTEFDARKRVEDRGGAIITSSSALVTFIFTITVVLTGKDKDASKFVSEGAGDLLLWALIVFVAAAVIGIFVQNFPLRYEAATAETLQQLVEDNSVWNGSSDWAAQLGAWLDLDAIESLRRGTTIKSYAATFALLLQGIAGMLLILALRADLQVRGLL